MDDDAYEYGIPELDIETAVDDLQEYLKMANMIIDHLSKNNCEVHIDIYKIKCVGSPEIPVINNRVYADLTKKRKVK